MQLSSHFGTEQRGMSRCARPRGDHEVCHAQRMLSQGWSAPTLILGQKNSISSRGWLKNQMSKCLENRNLMICLIIAAWSQPILASG